MNKDRWVKIIFGLLTVALWQALATICAIR